MNAYEFYGTTNAYVLADHAAGHPHHFADLCPTPDLLRPIPTNPASVWYTPEYLGGSDYSGGAVCRANYEAVRAIVSENSIENVEFIAGNFGGYSVAIRGDVDHEDIMNVLRSLEDDLVVDDDALYEMESELVEEAWANWAEADFSRELEKLFDFELGREPRGDQKTIRNIFDEWNNQGWAAESGPSMHADVKAVAKRVHDNLCLSDFAHLVTEFGESHTDHIAIDERSLVEKFSRYLPLDTAERTAAAVTRHYHAMTSNWSGEED